MTRNTSKLSTVAVVQKAGRGRGGSVRHRHRLAVQKSQDISKPAIRRLARRAGVKRISEGIYQEAPQALRAWLRTMVHDATVYADHAKRFTITTNDILLALKKNGVTLYGYAYIEKRERLTRKINGSSLQQAAVRVRSMHTPEKVASPAETPEVVVVEETPQVTVAKKTQTKMTGMKKRKSTPQSASRRNMAPKTPQDGQQDAAAGASTTVTPERAQEIQTSLSSFRDTVISRQASSDAPVPKVVDWVSAHMLGRGKAACTADEMNIVLEALSERDALMITDDASHSYRTVWFI